VNTAEEGVDDIGQYGYAIGPHLEDADVDDDSLLEEDSMR
jgi:hypothetical protein